MNDKINIPAIHDDDLKSILIKHGMYEKILKGEIHCYMSDEIITWDNIYGILEIKGEIKLVCDSSVCVEKLNNPNLDG
jgi:hypothetical protein